MTVDLSATGPVLYIHVVNFTNVHIQLCLVSRNKLGCCVAVPLRQLGSAGPLSQQATIMLEQNTG